MYSDNENANKEIIKNIKLLKDTQKGLKLLEQFIDEDGLFNVENEEGKEDTKKKIYMLTHLIYGYIDKQRIKYMELEEDKLITNNVNVKRDIKNENS